MPLPDGCRPAAPTPPRAHGVERPQAELPAVTSHVTRNQHERALSALADQARSHPGQVSLSEVVTTLTVAGVDWGTFVRETSPRFLEASLRAVPLLDVEAGLHWCQAFRDVHPDDPRPLVAGCVIAARSNLLDAMTWSIAARHAGLADLCPLRQRADQEDQPALERALLWALLAESFGEDGAVSRFHTTVVEMPDQDVPALTHLMVELTPVMAAELFGGGQG